MLVRVLTYRHEPLTVVVQKALSGGQQGVVHVNSDSDHAN
jgi:PTS system ascorbate-specific IIA component